MVVQPVKKEVQAKIVLYAKSAEAWGLIRKAGYTCT
jgi:hypothetical protein